MTTIRPTHTCFDDALDFVQWRLRQLPRGPLWVALEQRLVVVHGICLVPEGQPEAGKPFSHGWVEEADRHVWQMGILSAPGEPHHGRRVVYSLAKAEFYATLRVQETTRYTVREAARQNELTNSYGPWEAKYRELCRRAEEAA